MSVIPAELLHIRKNWNILYSFDYHDFFRWNSCKYLPGDSVIDSDMTHYKYSGCHTIQYSFDDCRLRSVAYSFGV